VVIVNPAAGNGRAGREWPELSRRLNAAGCAHTAVFTGGPGEATGLCRALLQSGRRYIVAAGGDGTLNEVLNGFFDPSGDDRLIAPEACLGVLPLGTGSDFVRTIGMHRSDDALQALAMGAWRLLDIGRLELQPPNTPPLVRYFANVADLGLGAETAYRVNHASKRLGAFLSYLIGAIRSIIAHRPQLVSLVLDEERPVEEPMSMIVVANSRYFGGGMPVVPHAEPDDGLLDILWLAGTSRGRLLVDLLPKLDRGAHLQHPAVRVRRAASVRVTCAGRLRLEIDGEQIGTAPATFRILPRVLRVVTPSRTTT
jgi:YegS/Rv2252/BmrU family lipid kinase